MARSVNQQPALTDEERAVWESRRRNNVRLGWVFGALALALFFLALWKYRPL